MAANRNRAARMTMNRREILLAAAATALPPLLSSRAEGARADTAVAVPEDPAALSLADASRAIHLRVVTSRELTTASLRRIKHHNPQINALITVMDQQALAQADALDAEAREGQFRSPLHGIPIALKDAIDTAGTRTTAASAQFENRVPSEDAAVVRRLRRAGAVIIAKANLAEFSVSPSGASSHFGPVRNPGDWIGSQAVRPVARLRRRRFTCALERSAPIRAVRCEFPPLGAGWSG